MISLMLGTVGLAYGSVPLYKMVRVQSTKRPAVSLRCEYRLMAMSF